MCAILTVLVGCAARGATAADPSSGSGTDVAGGNDGRSIGAGGLLAGLARRTKHHVDTLTPPPRFAFSFFPAIVAAAKWSCPSSFSNGPCFTTKQNWRDAQRTCESHGSNLATVLDADANEALAKDGCFSDAP